MCGRVRGRGRDTGDGKTAWWGPEDGGSGGGSGVVAAVAAVAAEAVESGRWRAGGGERAVESGRWRAGG